MFLMSQIMFWGSLNPFPTSNLRLEFKMAAKIQCCSPWPWPWPRGHLEDNFEVLGLGLVGQVLGLGLGLVGQVLGLALASTSSPRPRSLASAEVYFSQSCHLFFYQSKECRASSS